MAHRRKVVWSEGMFLRTQHFQAQDRYAEGLVRAATDVMPVPMWGFATLVVDEAARVAGQLGLEAATGLMPDGTWLDLARNTAALAPLQVERGSDTGIAYLGLPAEAEGGATIDPHHADASGARYHGRVERTRDVVRGGADAEDVEYAALVPRLILPGQETSGYTLLPVARLDGLDASGALRLNADFLAPALRISAVDWYARLLREISVGLERIADAHGGVLLAGTGASVENLLIAELANSAKPRIDHLISQGYQHPTDVFGELAGLAGRMSTYGSSSRRMTELPEYDHGDAQTAFSALVDTLRALILSLRHVEQKSRSLKVSRHSENVWTVRLDNPEIVQTSRIVVRVGGEMSETLLRKLFVDQATVGAADDFDKLWTTRLTGIPLKPLHSQPREIPYDGERLCLELDRASEHWRSLADAPGFVIGVSGALEREPEIDCYAIQR